MLALHIYLMHVTIQYSSYIKNGLFPVCCLVLTFVNSWMLRFAKMAIDGEMISGPPQDSFGGDFL